MECHTTKVRLFAILEIEISDTTHRRCFSFGQILVDAIDALRNVVECLSEQFRTLEESEQNAHKLKVGLPFTPYFIKTISRSL